MQTFPSRFHLRLPLLSCDPGVDSGAMMMWQAEDSQA